MLNLSMSMATAISSLRTNSYALNTTNHNVANMGNASYSRQLTNIATSTPLTIPGVAGQIGTGSNVSMVQRIRDIYLDRQIRTEWMGYGMAQILDRTYQNLQAYFPEVNSVVTDGLDAKINDFYKAWDEVAVQATLAAAGDPNTLVASLDTVYSNAKSVSMLLNFKSQGLTGMITDLNTDLNMAVETANTQIKQIFELNKLIVNILGQGQQPNDLMDLRDAAMVKLAEQVNFDSATRTDGSVVIFMGGRSLVNGNTGYELFSSSAANTVKGTVSIVSASSGNSVEVDSDMFSGGKIGGILRSEDLVREYKAQIDSIANTMITTVNKIYKASTESGTTVGKNFFSGSLAADISIHKDITKGIEITYKMFTDNDIAQVLGSLGNKLVSTVVYSGRLTNINTNPPATLPGPTPPLDALIRQVSTLTSGTLYVNDIAIAVGAGMTMKEFVNEINTHMSSVSAVYNNDTQEFYMVSNQALTIRESGLGGKFLEDMKLAEYQYSTSPVTSDPARVLVSPRTWLSQQDLLDIEVDEKGRVIIEMEGTKYPVDWYETDTISATRANIYNVDVMGPIQMGRNHFSIQGDWKFYFGTTVGSAGVPETISPFTISNETGNLTKTMKLIYDTRFNEYYSPVISSLKANIDNSASMLAMHKAAVDQLEGIQENITRVDEKQELAQAKLYQRSYDASVKLMSVIDEMLNMLINRTGTSSSSNE